VAGWQRAVAQGPPGVDALGREHQARRLGPRDPGLGLDAGRVVVPPPGGQEEVIVGTAAAGVRRRPVAVRDERGVGGAQQPGAGAEVRAGIEPVEAPRQRLAGRRGEGGAGDDDAVPLGHPDPAGPVVAVRDELLVRAAAGADAGARRVGEVLEAGELALTERAEGHVGHRSS
jgi:hypothetical protein